MTEAVQSVLDYGFNTLQLNLITANCYPHNERSQQVLKRHGFIYEGTLHQAELPTMDIYTTINVTIWPSRELRKISI